MIERDIIFIGFGNIGVNLAFNFINIGLNIVKIFLPDVSSKSLYQKHKVLLNNPELVTSFSDLYVKNEIIFIVTPDDAINLVVDQLSVLNDIDQCIVVHTSGMTPINILSDKLSCTGVFYPLQTFSRDKFISLKNVPIFIESNTDQSIKPILELAESVSTNVKIVDSKERSMIHLGAVFSSNFINAMILCSQNIVSKSNSFSYEIYLPLMNEVIAKVSEISPSYAQTGPAIRGDKLTIEKHLKLLEVIKPEYVTIYKTITKLINPDLL